MKVQTILLVLGFAISSEAYADVDPLPEPNPYKDKDYNNPVSSEFTEPTGQELTDLNKMKKLNVLEFYTALEELYLTGGFEKTGTINKIILSQLEIPKPVFDLIRKTLATTRVELKSGDSSLSTLDTVLEGEKNQQAKEMLKAIREAIRNATGTSDEETFIERISRIQLKTNKDLKNLNSGKGKDAQLLAQLLGELQKKIAPEDVNIISKAVQNAFYTGVGGTTSIRDTVVAGARLIYNFGGDLNQAKSKCSQVAQAYKRDRKFDKNLDGALEIVKRLNRTDGEYGYKQLFKVFFDEQAPIGNMLFLPSKMITMKTMLRLFKSLEKADVGILQNIVNALLKDRSRMRQFQWFVDRLQNDTVAQTMMKERFEVDVPFDKLDIYREIIENLTHLSVDSAYFLRYLKSVRDILESGNYRSFIDALVRFSQLSRGNTWRDVYISIESANTMVTPYEKVFLAPFQGLNESVTGSYEEVFWSMKLLDGEGKIEAKCQFIGEFFTGLKDRDTVLEAIGIPVASIHQWLSSTKYIDALVDVLKAADTYPNLNRLLDFHSSWTTVDKQPLESMKLIDEFLRFLEQSGRWNKKSSNRRSSRRN